MTHLVIFHGLLTLAQRAYLKIIIQTNTVCCVVSQIPCRRKARGGQSLEHREALEKRWRVRERQSTKALAWQSQTNQDSLLLGWGLEELWKAVTHHIQLSREPWEFGPRSALTIKHTAYWVPTTVLLFIAFWKYMIFYNPWGSYNSLDRKHTYTTN